MLSQESLNTLGKRLLFLRQSTNTTLQFLADKTGISRSNLSRYEKDEVKPSAESIVVLCDFYNVSSDWLLRRIEPQTQKIEAISDPDLQDMIDILKTLMESNDSDLRGWTKVQFKTAFKEYYAAHDEKRR